MRRALFTLFSFLLLLSASANKVETKTFLVLFKNKELKQHKTNLKSIETQFSAFDTKTYSGNSELALLIELPPGDFDECFVGDLVIEIGEEKRVKLQEIAFRVFDLTESEKNLTHYLQAFAEQSDKKKHLRAGL